MNQLPVLLLTLILSLGTGHAQSVVGDAVILRMNEAFQKNDSQALTELLPRAEQHLLAPWAAYWELRTRLDRASNVEINDFLRRYAGTYQEDRLRNDWLVILGQRRDWTRFAAVASDYRMNDDRDVRCYALAMKSIVSHVNVADEVKAQWYAQKDAASDACALAAQSHYEAGYLTDADIWRKARLTTEARRFPAARLAVSMVAPQANAFLKDVLDTPEHFLSRATPNSPLMQELTVLALIRLADSNVDMAAHLLTKRAAKYLSAAQISWAWGVIGKQSALTHSNSALPYFSHAKLALMSDEHLAWLARMAMRHHQWHDAQDAMTAMSTEAAQQPTWVYWKARALSQPGKNTSDRKKAQNLLRSIAGGSGFYELLAQEELALPITALPRPAPLTALEKSSAKNNPGLKRALAAIALGLRGEGVREWNYTTHLHTPGGMSDRELLAAADLACQHAVWDRCINTSERTKKTIDLNQRYPMPHLQTIIQRSRAVGIDPAYVYGLIRQESRFVTNAQSGVGAAGLMQIMPKTAQWTAKHIGLTDFKPYQIVDLDTNIAIGTGYLKLILDTFAGSMPMAAAAYNAGPSRPRSWRSTGTAMEAAIWIESIPFAETRDYVKKVMANTILYAANITKKPQSIKTRLGNIGPRPSSMGERMDLP